MSRNGLAGGFGIFCGLLTVVSLTFKTFNLLMVYCALFSIGSGLFKYLSLANLVLNFFEYTKQILSLLSFNKFTLINVVFFLLAFYVGLHGACIFDVVGLKNLARGYAIKACALGLGSLMTISTAGNDILRQLSK